jgi:hypothetical protein
MLNNNNALSIYIAHGGDVRAYVLMAFNGRLHPKIFPLCVCMASVSVMPRWVSDSRPWRPPLCLNTTLQGIWFLITLQTQINACIELWLMRRHFPRFFPGTTPPRAMKAEPIGDQNNCFPGTCAFCAYAHLLISRTSSNELTDYYDKMSPLCFLNTWKFLNVFALSSRIEWFRQHRICFRLCDDCRGKRFATSA